MNQAFFRFYEELNDFLPAGKRKQQFTHLFKGNPSVKDIIESLGIPHVEVDLILINGRSAGFSEKVMDKDTVSVYPVFESFDIAGVQHLRPEPLRETKFVADVHLGKLVRYLRLAGFDTLYEATYSDSEIVRISIHEKRIILTRDKMLLRARVITHGYWIRSSDPAVQIIEVLDRFDLRNTINPFTRCIECNHQLVEIPKKEIEDRLPLKTRKYYEKFIICTGCGKVYWEGSHYENMKKMILAFRSGKPGT